MSTRQLRRLLLTVVVAGIFSAQHARADGAERFLGLAADLSFWVVGLFAVVAFIFAIRFIRSVLSERAVSRVVVWTVELDGQPVGTVESPKFEDMFWSVWCVVPLHPQHAALLTTKENWDQCRFRFRDPRSGALGSTFSGGRTPTADDMHVALRWFHWERDLAKKG